MNLNEIILINHYRYVLFLGKMNIFLRAICRKYHVMMLNNNFGIYFHYLMRPLKLNTEQIYQQANWVVGFLR